MKMFHVYWCAAPPNGRPPFNQEPCGPKGRGERWVPVDPYFGACNVCLGGLCRCFWLEVAFRFALWEAPRFCFRFFFCLAFSG